MRIIAGQFRSRKLQSVSGLAVRPTPDRLREALFNVLAPRMEGSVFVDAYAGSGVVGFEAVSRGAARVIFIENNQAALDVLRRNALHLGVAREITIVRGRASTHLPDYAADLVFLDPPYKQTDEYETSLKAARLLPGGYVIAQHATSFRPPENCGNLHSFRHLRQGDNCLTFYRASDEF
jgi:16S rRNA (guanine(966)-N(2))-methyltransferase RsmD